MIDVKCLQAGKIDQSAAIDAATAGSRPNQLSAPVPSPLQPLMLPPIVGKASFDIDRRILRQGKARGQKIAVFVHPTLLLRAERRRRHSPKIHTTAIMQRLKFRRKEAILEAV
jgi:hypothetical protein